jgi:hypothetical protein
MRIEILDKATGSHILSPQPEVVHQELMSRRGYVIWETTGPRELRISNLLLQLGIFRRTLWTLRPNLIW